MTKNVSRLLAHEIVLIHKITKSVTEFFLTTSNCDLRFDE